jgi:DNA-binding SARP family transcriptional activator
VIELRLLGPVEVLVDGRPVALPAKPRTLLAALALERGRVVSTERLVDVLWDERPPEQAVKTIQVYVSQLRRALGAETVETVGAGYRLAADRTELDVTEFERLAAAAETLPAALALWRGPALAGLDAAPPWRAEAARLEELRLAALEDLFDAELAQGRHARLVPQLERHVTEHPERERAAAQLMLALYRSGRQEEALDVYRRTRADLVERLGIEPGPDLRELHGRILRQDANIAAPAVAGAVPPTGARTRHRRTAATVVALALAGGVAALVLALTGGSSDRSPALRTYVLKVENFLSQSHAAHREIVGSIVAARRCSIPSGRAAAAIDRVQRSRQSLLQQLAALSVPSQREALRSFDLLQKAAQASIAADWRYRDWLRARRSCARGASPPAAVLTLDRRATRLKSAFVSAFRPLARRFGAREWRDLDF